MENVLQFEPLTHTYSVGGRVVPSVTTVIKAVWPELYDHCTDFARERGSIVHEIIHLHLTGELDESSVSPVCSGYFAAAKRFIAESGIEIRQSERRLYSQTYGYAGTLDIVGMLNGRRVLGDWKSGDPGWQAGLQLAAYAQAWHETTGELIQDRIAVWLHEDGTYTVVPFKDYRGDFADFAAALRVLARREQIATRRLAA